ncbi:hypothetical protein ACGFK1_24325 [Mycobacterium sp. NPDC048908]|uniref:hypothetical protein n=1 Tax=Mycobacterium sp. NPDC048908 TaxID=3364292 RepID=UPI003724713E
MTVPRPHDRPLNTHARLDDALETYTVGLPRWRVLALFRRNPLVRASDRVEALVIALTVLVSVLAIPIAAAIGTAVHDSRRDVYAQQHDARHLVTATVAAQSAVEPDEPTPTSRAGLEAATAALFMWAGVTATAAVLLAGTRAVCDRIRENSWQHTIDNLLGRGSTNPRQP